MLCCAAWAPPADAAARHHAAVRHPSGHTALPTRTEATAILRAFAEHHPKRDVILTIKVLRPKRAWARARFVAPATRRRAGARAATPRSATPRGPKIIYFHNRGSSRHPRERPVKHPPAPVRRDLARDTYLKITIAGMAKETGDFKSVLPAGENDDGCGDQTLTWDNAVTVNFNETRKFNIDSLTAAGSDGFPEYQASAPLVDPTYGDLVETIDYKQDDQDPRCTHDDFTANGTGSVHALVGERNSGSRTVVTTKRGAMFHVPFPPLTSTTFSDGRPHQNELAGIGYPRLVATAIGAFHVPWLGVGDVSAADLLGTYRFDTSDNAFNLPATVHDHEGWCEAGGDAFCTDTVTYSGTVAIEPWGG